MTLPERITARLQALNMSANAASAAAGLSRDYVRDILRGRVQEPSAARLSRLAAVLQCTTAYLTGETDDAGLDTEVKQHGDLCLDLRYRLRAGFHEDDDGFIQTDIVFPMFAPFGYTSDEWLEFVVTDQADGAFATGTLLHTVPAGAGLADEEYVVCLERLRHGRLMRRSVRQISLLQGLVSFTPETSLSEEGAPLPTFQESELLSGQNAAEITIVGRVWAAYQELRPEWKRRMRATTRNLA